MNLPWSRRVKMRRGTSVNGDKREGCMDFAVNEGGTAEVFGPFLGQRSRRFLYLSENLIDNKKKEKGTWQRTKN